MSRALVILSALLALGIPLAAPPAHAQGDETLQKLVIVMRDGISAPAASGTELANWAAQPWPEWNRPAGTLTPRGAQLAGFMGRYYRQFASAAGATMAA